MKAQPALDPKKVEQFLGRVLGDTSATLTTTLATLGDRLGLFKDLAENGPATSNEFASRTGINERYAREWLGGMASASYIEYDPVSGRFTLPPEHVPALAEENGEFFFGGVYQMMPALAANLDQLTECFRSGGGVPLSAYNDNMWDGLERFTGGWYEHQLLQKWLPVMPNVQARLEHGALVADVGCGRGRALIKLAQAFPNSRYTGYDNFGPTIDRASANAKTAGVDDRVRFQQLDASKGVPEQFDVITTFEVVHDAVDPLGLLRAIRQALKADGIYVCLDVNCSNKLEENRGPLARCFTVSVYCTA